MVAVATLVTGCEAGSAGNAAPAVSSTSVMLISLLARNWLEGRGKVDRLSLLVKTEDDTLAMDGARLMLPVLP
ncbi:hypothetical protein [Bordetella genomosp. 11]|uniref:Uncharacterized protein n=1 Tax=Bordetella genomosp. 11 TaxID=1416808 RepID=A0A261UF97_9BORD|nr:hypothetical protein [Bordetella genomosp. 11]OZI60265.1 hypothetical protein CAL28_12550 [Bordetella genomosp. 11]